jgi:hypothetical protein
VGVKKSSFPLTRVNTPHPTRSGRRGTSGHTTRGGDIAEQDVKMNYVRWKVDRSIGPILMTRECSTHVHPHITAVQWYEHDIMVYTFALYFSIRRLADEASYIVEYLQAILSNQLSYNFTKHGFLRQIS